MTASSRNVSAVSALLAARQRIRRYHALVMAALSGEVVRRATGRTVQELFAERAGAPYASRRALAGTLCRPWCEADYPSALGT